MTDWIKVGKRDGIKRVNKTHYFTEEFADQLKRFAAQESLKTGPTISQGVILETSVKKNPDFRKFVRSEQEAHDNNQISSESKEHSKTTAHDRRS